MKNGSIYKQTSVGLNIAGVFLGILIVLLIIMIIASIVLAFKRRDLLLRAKCSPCVLKVKELKSIPWTGNLERFLCENCRK